MSTGFRSSEFSAPRSSGLDRTGSGIESGNSSHAFGDGSPLQMADVAPELSRSPLAAAPASAERQQIAAAAAVSSPGGDATITAPPIVAPATPLLNDTIKQELAPGTELSFSTPASNEAANSPPDYRLSVGDDGQLKLEKIGDGNALDDGKLNIEVDPKNKSLEEAIQQADKNLKEYVREMMTLWQANNPGKPYPAWWDKVLNSQPEIPTTPPPPVPAQPAPVPQQYTPGPSGSPSGGRSPGGNFAGRGGFDPQGYFKGNGARNEGSAWTGQQNSQGQPIGEGTVAKAKDIYDYLIKNDFTPAQASGILGNIQTESDFNTGAYNRGEGAIGICQWRLDRRQNLEAFAARQNKPVTDLTVQLDFMMHEFRTSERGAYAAVKAAETPEQAAQAFQSKFERSTHLGPRAANAAQWHSRLANA